MNILTIDDSATMRMLIKKTLQPDGYTILEADNGQSGLNVAAADKIDLFFVDVNMPVMDGLECVSRLKKDAQYANTPIVFLTTVTDTEKKQMGQSLGVNGWIQKPFNPDQLRKLTKMATSLKQCRQSNCAINSLPKTKFRKRNWRKSAC